MIINNADEIVELSYIIGYHSEIFISLYPLVGVKYTI